MLRFGSATTQYGVSEALWVGWDQIRATTSSDRKQTYDAEEARNVENVVCEVSKCNVRDAVSLPPD